MTRIPGGDEILGRIRLGAGARLLPPPEARILIDRDYRFSALGTLAQVYHEEVAATFRDVGGRRGGGTSRTNRRRNPGRMNVETPRLEIHIDRIAHNASR